MVWCGVVVVVMAVVVVVVVLVVLVVVVVLVVLVVVGVVVGSWYFLTHRGARSRTCRGGAAQRLAAAQGPGWSPP